MILIFGGTTEGRIAVDVCEEAGRPFFYSTKSDLQQIETHNGLRLSGGMSADEIKTFCQTNDIRCIINAAHPFAENLHQAIATAGIPVIRLQRDFGKHIGGVCYCSGYTEAIEKIKQARINCLLALSGVNTISKLEAYWRNHKTIFRILNREESIEHCRKAGFPLDSVVFYNSNNHLPTKEDEMVMMKRIGCDAILTKESGTSGGFEEKVDAAMELGLKVFVVNHPALPKTWTYVTGKYGLRRAIENIVPDFFKLKTGLTTGACATAATKAALQSLLWDDDSEEVSFALPDGEILTIPVEHDGRGTASVRKDYNDDPDVTKGCRITSHVELHIDKDGQNDNINNEKLFNKEEHENETAGKVNRSQRIFFLQGNGVGKVTLPGLGIPIGGPAVNPTPRKMIANETRQLTDKDIDVTISVENGEEIAKKTFNPRVGVINGISILGTSGIVRPLSNEAFISSIRRELNVAWAIGCREIGLVAGMKSENALKKEKDIRCIHYGNFIGEALKAAHEIGFRRATLAIMIGKAVKLAEGHLDTHSHKFVMNKNFLKQTAIGLGIDPAPIDGITMARELWGIMPKEFFNKITTLCKENCMTVFQGGEIDIRLICDTQQQ